MANLLVLKLIIHFVYNVLNIKIISCRFSFVSNKVQGLNNESIAVKTDHSLDLPEELTFKPTFEEANADNLKVTVKFLTWNFFLVKQCVIVFNALFE